MEFRKAEEEFYMSKCKRIMEEKALPLVEKDANIERVLSKLVRRTHVWVTESRGSKKVVGVITEHDVLSIFALRGPTYTLGIPDMRTLHRGKAEDVMTKRIVSCAPNDTINDALDKMVSHGMRRLPVVGRDNNILGEVRLHQIIKKFSEIKGWK